MSPADLLTPQRHTCFIFAIVLALTAGCRRAELRAQTETQSPDLIVVQLDSGVYAAIRNNPLSLAVNANSLIIVRNADVVVVDAQFTRAATQETLRAIRKITHKPVAYVINTHWHDDHLAGDQVYQDSFPSVRFVMQRNTAEDLVKLGVPNRKGQVEGAPAVVDRLERLLALGLGMDSTPASPLERSALESAIRIARQYLKEAPGFRPVTATDTVHRRMTLGRGDDRIDLLWFGNANTRGDLIVYLPSRGIVATGDVVGAPVPFAFNSYPASWVKVLDSVLALEPSAVVPGHGPVMHDLRHVRSIRDWLERITREASAAAARGDSLALGKVTLDDMRPGATGDEKWMNFLFRSFFVRPAAQAAWGQAVRR
jgi:cyclase